MNCAEFETVLCDYMDGVLSAAAREQAEWHISACPACAELARDAAAATAFLERVPDVEVPQELLTRILFHAPRTAPEPERHSRWSPKRWFAGWLQPLLQPRFAMGMAMTILSFSLLGRVAGLPQRQLTADDLQPARIVLAIEDKLVRAWDRAVKYYENLRLVYQIQAQLEEWSAREEEDRRARAAGAPITPSAGNAGGQEDQKGQATEGREVQ